VINPTVQSAKSAGPLAAAWAVLRHVGLDRYRSLALAARDALLRLAAGVSAVDGLRVLGVPDSTLLAVAGDDVDVFAIADELRVRGFYAQVQLSLADVPANLHFSAHAVSPSTVDALLAALRESVEAARKAGPVPVSPALAGIDLSTLDEAGCGRLLARAGLGSMAAINAALDSLPPAAREQALRLFLSTLLTPG
jgi:sphinganine-1-phosphate aldolase